MKFNVEMTESELKQYLQFKEGKMKDEQESNRLYRKILKIRDALYNAIIKDKNGVQGLKDVEEAEKLFDLVEDIYN